MGFLARTAMRWGWSGWDASPTTVDRHDTSRTHLPTGGGIKESTRVHGKDDRSQPTPVKPAKGWNVGYVHGEALPAHLPTCQRGLGSFLSQDQWDPTALLLSRLA